MKKFGMAVLEWGAKLSIGFMLIVVLIICFPIALIGDMMNEHTRRKHK